jgi:hypothetical protein
LPLVCVARGRLEIPGWHHTIARFPSVSIAEELVSVS